MFNVYSHSCSLLPPKLTNFNLLFRAFLSIFFFYTMKPKTKHFPWQSLAVAVLSKNYQDLTNQIMEKSSGFPRNLFETVFSPFVWSEKRRRRRRKHKQISYLTFIDDSTSTTIHDEHVNMTMRISFFLSLFMCTLHFIYNFIHLFGRFAVCVCCFVWNSLSWNCYF